MNVLKNVIIATVLVYYSSHDAVRAMPQEDVILATNTSLEI